MWSAGPYAGAAHAHGVPASLVTEVSGPVFASPVRSGHRLKAERYVRALLDVPGRKTLKSIGAQWGGAAAGQSAHHFIAASPWDWRPVRRAVARYARQELAPGALVVAPAVVRRSPPRPDGSGPQAFGAWLVSADGTVPVDWHSISPPCPGSTTGRPSRAGTGLTPAETGTLLEVATGAARLLRPWHGPVVVDADGPDPADLIRELHAHAEEFLVRVAPGTPLRIDRTRLPRHDTRQRTAAGLATALTGLRRPLDPFGTAATGTAATATAVPVTFGRRFTREDPPALLLLGRWEGGREPRSLWLTNIRSLPLPALMRLTRLPDRVGHDVAGVSDRLGLRDYAGRSHHGLHRHLTLVSVAQLLTVVHRAADRTSRPRAA